MIPAGEWKGQAAFIIGGGPSLIGFDPEQLRGKGRIVAINDAGLTLMPWADVLYWGDRRWFEWNHPKLGLHQGRYKFTRIMPRIAGHPLLAEALIARHDIKVLGFKPGRLSTTSKAVGGHCSGSAGINIAWLMGADPIVLLGFDMHDLPLDRWQEGYWHDHHQKPPAMGSRKNRFMPALERMAKELKDAGATVLNATPGSALKCFPAVNLQDVLERL